MKLLPLLALFPLLAFGQAKQDTTRAPKVYWSDLQRIQAIAAELDRRVHRLDIRALSRDTLDGYLSLIGSALPAIYQRTYADSTKKGGKR